MPITPLNRAKNSISPNSVNKYGYAKWDDDVVTWDSSTLFWDSPLQSFNVNLNKNTITPINKVKN